mmetsp:Transcript_16702/g.38451  ORF Transcript_16702/g.38451 Transcript_16702/m.38451 type:complete len:323 (-) Transcript_16702:281-1249(-)
MEQVDRLQAMLRQEVTSYRTVDYLAPDYQTQLLAARFGQVEELILEDGGTASSASSTGTISESWRDKICEWCYQVVDHFDYSREVVSVAMHYLDRFLARKVVNKRVFQLAAMAALVLAVKLNEPAKLSMSAMIELSRGYFTVAQMEAMELSLMRELQWLLHPPCSFNFIKNIVYLLPQQHSGPHARQDILELSRFLSELSIIDYFFVAQRPSHVAVAAIANAMQSIGTVSFQTQRDFLELLALLDMNVEDEGIVNCRYRLQLLYSQGGYANASSQQPRPESTPSPVSVAYGTQAYQPPTEESTAAPQQDTEKREGNPQGSSS